MLEKKEKRYKRHKRIRAKISGTAKRPRFYVFRTPKHIYVQIIDDEKGRSILSMNDINFKKSKLQIKNKKEKKEKEEIKRTRKVAIAYEIGKLIAQKALEKKIKEVVFDRGGYKYHGRVKAVAEGARKGGLEF